MVSVIEEHGIVVGDWEEKAKESGVTVSVGYLRKSAKNDIAVGHKLVEYFLSQFPEVDANWLITGEHSETGGTKIDQGWQMPLAIAQKDILLLRAQAENLKQRIEILEGAMPTAVGKA